MAGEEDQMLDTLLSALKKECTVENFNKACRWILSHPEAHPYIFAGAAVVVMGFAVYDSIEIGEENHKLLLERIESIRKMKNKDDQEDQFNLLQKQIILWKRERRFRGAIKIGVGIGLVSMALSAVVGPAIRMIVGGSGTVTAGAGAYDWWKSYDNALVGDLKTMLERKGHLKAN